MIRILHSVSYMGRGGIETMLMNYYRHIDRSKIQFDFLCNAPNEGAYDKEILDMGGHIFRSPGFNPLKHLEYCRFMSELFASHPEYKIIEAHNGPLGRNALKAAKDAGVPIRIYHAHGAGLKFDLKWPIKYYCKKMLKYSMNEYFVCSIKAGQFYMGDKIMRQGNYHFIPNAIEIDKFLYNIGVRDSLRNKYKLNGKIVVGHIGRFSPQKNHKFLLNVFAEYHRFNPAAYLVLIGDGEMRSRVLQKIESMGLKDSVLFVGSVDNANEWYQAFDLFLLPSLWEGLPVVGIEAQASGLQCIFSSSVTKEVALSQNAHFVSLDAPISEWVDMIKVCVENSRFRTNMTNILIEKHYDIAAEAKLLENLYLEYAQKVGL